MAERSAAQHGNDTKPTFHIGRAARKAVGTIRIVAVADTLGIEPHLPPADIVICAGNYTSRTGSGLDKFSRWLSKVPAYTITVSGRNEGNDSARPSNAICLEGATTLIHGLRITSATVFGSFKPWQIAPDIVVSAVPPFGILDVNEHGKHVGSAELRYMLETKPPRVIIFGGNPHGHGAMWLGLAARPNAPAPTLCVNAGIWGEATPMVKYGVPLIVDLTSDKRNRPRQPRLG